MLITPRHSINDRAGVGSDGMVFIDNHFSPFTGGWRLRALSDLFDLPEAPQ